MDQPKRDRRAHSRSKGMGDAQSKQNQAAPAPEAAPPAAATDEISLCAPRRSHTTRRSAHPACSAYVRSDPPLGFVPAFTFKSPVFSGASERWKKGGGSTGLMRIMRCAPVRQSHAAELPLTAAHLRHGSDEVNVNTYNHFLRYVVAMLVVPAVVMFVSYNFLLDHLFTFNYRDERMTYAGLAALASVQVVIVKFLVFAFNEDTGDGTPKPGAPAKPKST